MCTYHTNFFDNCMFYLNIYNCLQHIKTKHLYSTNISSNAIVALHYLDPSLRKCANSYVCMSFILINKQTNKNK